MGDPDSVLKNITDALLRRRYVLTGSSGSTHFFRYPSLIFSSKRPLTCISRLSLEVTDHNELSLIKVGVTFTKIRYYTIIMVTFLCVVVPAGLGIVQKGTPDMPPMAFLGIPLGVLVHFHVRGRVFRALGRLIHSMGES